MSMQWKDIKNNVQRVTNTGYEKTKELLFGKVNEGYDTDAELVTDFKDGGSEVIPMTKAQSEYAHSVFGGSLIGEEKGVAVSVKGAPIYTATVDHAGVNTERIKRFTTDTRYRYGPIPRDQLSYAEKTYLSTNACLEEIDDLKEDDVFSPSNKSLLSYFARLGNGEDDTENLSLDFIDSLLNSGADFNFTDAHGQSVFFGVVRDWSVSVAEFALSRGAEINHVDKYGRSPLHVAASVNHHEMVRFLANNGANIRCQTKGQLQTPMHFASQFSAIDSMKILLELAPDTVLTKDCFDRTPLHVAAELGQREAVKFLLELGLPAGDYDNIGNSTVALLANKIPDLAYEGLDQFYVEDIALRTSRFYIDSLEYPAKGKICPKEADKVIEVIVNNMDTKLITHPVVNTLIREKFKSFGLQYAVFENFLYIFYAMLNIVLQFSMTMNNADNQFTPFKDNAWKLAIAGLLLLMTLFIILQAILGIHRGFVKTRMKRDFKVSVLKKKYAFCHPRWASEKEFLDAEFQHATAPKSSVDLFMVFDLVACAMVLVSLALHGYNIYSPSVMYFRMVNLASSVVLMATLLRLYKSLRMFVLLAQITIMLGAVAKETFKFLILYLDIFIPFTFVFWLMFGGGPDRADLTKYVEPNGKSHSYDTFLKVLYQTWILLVKEKYETQPMWGVNPYIAEVLLSVYMILVTIMLSQIFIAMLVDVFSRLQREINAKAMLIVAANILRCEARVSETSRRNFRRHLRLNCNPLEMPLIGIQNQSETYAYRLNIYMRNLAHQIDATNDFMENAGFADSQQDRRSATDQLTVFRTDLEKMMTLQGECDDELNIMKAKISVLQKKAVDVVSDSIASGKKRNKRKKGAKGKSVSGYETE